MLRYFIKNGDDIIGTCGSIPDCYYTKFDEVLIKYGFSSRSSALEVERSLGLTGSVFRVWTI